MRQLAFLFATLAPARRRVARPRGRQEPDLRRRRPAHRQAALRRTATATTSRRAASTSPPTPTMQKGGSSGAVVMPGNPDKSRLFTAHRPPRRAEDAVAVAEDPGRADRHASSSGSSRARRRTPAARSTSRAMPKTDIGLKSVVKGRPEGPPPMPALGKLKLDPVVVARRPGAVLALADKPVGAARRRRRAEAGHPLQHRHRRTARRHPVRARADQQHQVLAQRTVRPRRRRQGRAVRQGGAVQGRDRREGAGSRQERDRRDPRRRHLRRPDADRRRRAVEARPRSTPRPTARCCARSRSTPTG